MVLRSAGESVVDYGSRRVVAIAVSTWYCGLLERVLWTTGQDVLSL